MYLYFIILSNVLRNNNMCCGFERKERAQRDKMDIKMDHNSAQLAPIESKQTGDIQPATNFTTEENPFTGGSNKSEFSWLNEAIRDIAYYLRAHKFNEYDRRYHPANDSNIPKDYFMAFPSPPLRSLHWEVHKFCEPSFLSCMEYMRRRVKNTGLRRTDDTAVIVQEQSWNKTDHAKEIDVVEEDCRKMQKKDDNLANPFQGPIERFQWRVTASYYLCWYTMNEVPDLEHFNDRCDNFANCLDPEYGVNSLDPRAEDEDAYSCAQFSFCPDPCCPLRHLARFEQCWDNRDNPCSAANLPGQRECTLNRSRNKDFNDILLNRWNVTCECPQEGFVWNSHYGMCIDIDECTTVVQHGCDEETEACVNLPGSYECACRWGYVLDARGEKCEPHPALSLIKLEGIKVSEEGHQGEAKSLVKRVYDAIFHKSSTVSYKRRISFVIAVVPFVFLLC